MKKKKKIKRLYKNNKFKISAPTWNEKFKLAEGPYSILHIQDYLKYTVKKHGDKTFNT